MTTVLAVLAGWTCLAVPAAAFVAALGRSSLHEDKALGHLPARRGTPAEGSHPGPDQQRRPASTR